jgi:hypothetical protein
VRIGGSAGASPLAEARARGVPRLLDHIRRRLAPNCERGASRRGSPSVGEGKSAAAALVITKTNMRLPILLTSFALAAAACGGGGDDSNGSGDSLGMLLTDAPVDGLSLFTVDILSVQLLRADGTATGNLLPATRNYDVLGLAGLRALLGLADPPAGTYTGVRLAVDPATVAAADATGTPVDVRVTRATDDATFMILDATNLVIGSAFQDLLLDIDLDKSLSDDLTNPGGLVFELELESEHEIEDEGFDEFRGRVVSESADSGNFVADLLDDSGSTTFGRVTVAVSAGDVLIGEDEQLFGSVAAFFAALAPGMEVEVHGSFAFDGTVNATIVEIEDGLNFPVKIKGELLAVDAGAQEFTFLWKEVRRGSSLVFPVLAQIGNPRVLDVAWDASTVFTVEDGGGSTTSAALVPGTEVYVHFLDFAAPMPFLAAGVELDDDGAEFEGTITDISGLPGSFVMQPDTDEPSWTSGFISAPVTVNLAAVSRIWLDTETEPTLDASDLLTGLKVEVHGALSGSPASATITASQLKVKPGELEGTISAVNPGAGTLVVNVQEVDDPFGSPDPSGTITAAVPADSWIEGDDGPLTLNALASLFATLGAGEILTVELEGIGDGLGSVIAWEIAAEVED